MNGPRYREITCAILIDTSGRLLVQRRDDVVGIVHAGKVGLFGGHREGDETFLECVVREIHEEICYFVPAERFEYLASLPSREMHLVEGIAGIFKVVGTFVRCKGPEDLADRGASVANGAGGDVAQQMLELGEDPFDGVQRDGSFRE
jgi:ADP-ribose pyrophosphatase YjhB (NUDIX family)